MKKLKKTALAAIISVAGLNLHAVGGIADTSFVQTLPGSLSTDVQAWLGIIDTVYNTYDQIMNQIQMIQGMYEQAQFAIEQAQSMNFDEIMWDGDFDFRNEIADATSMINSRLNNFSKLQDMFNTQNINLNGQSFSIADITGFSSDTKSVTNFANALKGEFDSKCEQIKKYATGDVTDEEMKYLWSKYGLSPRNYMLVKNAKDFADCLVKPALVEAARKLEQQEPVASTEKFWQELMLDMGNSTQTKDILKHIGMGEAKICSSIESLRDSVQTWFAAQAALNVENDRIEEARKQQIIEEYLEKRARTISPNF